MMQGKIVHDTFIVMDSFALPVEGTETRVNAQVGFTLFFASFSVSVSASSLSHNSASAIMPEKLQHGSVRRDRFCQSGVPAQLRKLFEDTCRPDIKPDTYRPDIRQAATGQPCVCQSHQVVQGHLAH